MIAVVILIALVLGLPLMLLLYWLAVRSRRTYYCPNCGASMKVEHMAAVHCNQCGTPLKEMARDH